MKGRLPSWLEQWLGVSPSSSGQGTAWRLDATWNWAPWLTLLFALLLIAVVIYVYARETSEASRRVKACLIALRLGALAILLLMIAELIIALERTGLPTVAVILDRSGSMGVGDQYDQPRRQQMLEQLKQLELDEPLRINLAKLLLARDDGEFLRSLQRHYRLVVYEGATAAQRLPGGVSQIVEQLKDVQVEGEGTDATRLGAIVRQVLADLQGTPPAALILITDGITTDGETLSDASLYARRKGVPLLTVGLGDEHPVQDIELADLYVDDVVFAGDMVTFDVSLAASGFEGETVNVQLKNKATGETLAQEQVTLAGEGVPQPVRLMHRPSGVGDVEFVVAVEPVADELRTDNNELSRIVSIREEKVRVLLAQSAPSYEFRFLKHLLQRDESIDLNVYLQEADQRYAQQDEAAIRVFPVRRDDLFDYDVLILGDVDPARLTRSVLRNIQAFVTEKGGGLMFVAGPRYLPWRFRDSPEITSLLPVDLATVEIPDPTQIHTEGFTMLPTQLGMGSPPLQLGDSRRETELIWRRLPPLYWLLEVADVKPAARVLAEHPTRSGRSGRKLPLIVLQYVGAGKVLFHATDETWRWRYRVGDVFFARYWIQTIRYLARAKLLGGEGRVELSVQRREFQRWEPVRIRARFLDERRAPAADDGVTIVVQRPGATRRRVTLRRQATARGVFEAALTDLGEGAYHAVLVRPTTQGRAPAVDFQVLAPPGEFERLERDTAALSQAAQATRGKLYEFEDAHRILDDLPKGRDVPIEQLPPYPLWNRWGMLVAFLALVITEWALRKRKGML